MNGYTNLSIRSHAVTNVALRVAGLSPCLDCPDRYPGCGSACDRYKEWKANIAKAKTEAEAHFHNGRDADAVLIESYQKARKRGGWS